MYIRLAWRNLWRNRNRTLITMASVFLAVILAILIDSWQTGVFGNFIKNVVSLYSGYVQIHKKGYWDEQILENGFHYSDSLIAKVKSNRAVTDATPRIEMFALVSSGQNTKGCLVTGINPEREAAIIDLRNRLFKGEYFSADDSAVMIGAGLAEQLQVGVSDTIYLLGQGYQGANAAGKYPVKGILQFGSPDLNDRVLFLPIAEAQHLLAAENVVTSIVLSIEENDDAQWVKNELVQALDTTYEVMTWEDMMPEMVQHIKTDKASGFIMTLILYLLVSFGIFSTLLMMMAERRFELGMLMAVGMKKLQLSRMLLLESFFVTLSGCIIGIALSIPIVTYLKFYPIRFGGEIAKIYKKFGFEPIYPTATDPVIFIKQTSLVLVIAMVLALYPVYKILTMNPVKAMRK